MPYKILFADDSMTAQNMGKKILTDAGYEVIAVSNGAVAARKLADKPDIIIVDIYMPGYSGLEICEQVRSTLAIAKTPVLLTVGKMEPYKPEDGNRVKADGVIVKPFEASNLIAAVKALETKIVSAPPKPAPKPVMQEAYSEPHEEHMEEMPPMQFEVPADMAAAPAFGEFLTEELSPDTMLMDAPSANLWGEIAPGTVPPVPDFSAEFQETQTATNAPEFGSQADHAAQLMEQAVLETVTATEESSGEFSPPSASENQVEFTSAPRAADVEIITEAALETGTQEAVDFVPIQDPALATDPTEMVTDFATRFSAVNDPEGWDAPSGDAITEDASAEPEQAATEVSEAVTENSGEAASTEMDDFEARVAAAMANFSDTSDATKETATVGEAEAGAEGGASAGNGTAMEDQASVAEETSFVAAPEAGPEADEVAETAPGETEFDESKVGESVTAETAQVEEEQAMSMDEETMADEETLAAPAPMEMEEEVSDAEFNPEPAPDAAAIAMDSALAAAPAQAFHPQALHPQTSHPQALYSQALHPEDTANAKPAGEMAAAEVEVVNALEAAAPEAAASANSRGMDPNTIAQVVSRVLEKMLPSIMAEVAKELDLAKKL